LSTQAILMRAEGCGTVTPSASAAPSAALLN
jgi:hypothetical protein